MLFALILLFADGDTPATPTGPPSMSSFIPMVAIGLVFIVMFTLTSRRSRNQQQNLLTNLKRNDKVITNAGIIGVVVDVREKRDDDIKEEELVLRVDDSTNTRMRVLKSSVVRVFSSQPAAAADKK